MTQQLQTFDKGNPKLPRHTRPSSTDDEFETPKELFMRLCNQYSIYPTLDVAATKENRLCLDYYSKENNALEQEFNADFWCNHPHTLHAEFVEKCCLEHKKHNRNGMMIIPTNCQRTTYWHKFIENETECFVENHPIKGSIIFLKNGKPVLDKRGRIQQARNAYRVVIWRRI